MKYAMNAQWKFLGIEHNRENQQFELDLSEQGKAELKYEIMEGRDETVIDFTRTFVPPEVRNRGLGKALVRQGLSFAKQAGYKGKGSCPFVESFLDDGEHDAIRTCWEEKFFI